MMLKLRYLGEIYIPHIIFHSRYIGIYSKIILNLSDFKSRKLNPFSRLFVNLTQVSYTM